MSQLTVDYIGSKEVENIVNSYGFKNKDISIKKFEVHKASDQILGFMADYLKLKVVISDRNELKILHFFIKAMPRGNVSKANMVNKLNFYEKELTFYSAFKSWELFDIKPWSPKFVTELNKSIVLEDLNALQYKIRDKFDRFDIVHTKQALRTLARFHASSIIYEERKSQNLKTPYRLNEDYDQLFDEGGYSNSCAWYVQCRIGTLAILDAFSKYKENKEIMNTISTRWNELWASAFEMSNSSEQRSVLCHRDLWNNNILFHYNTNDGNLEPDDCVLVDFQAVKYLPPASDVMQLLYCNLDPKLREQNMDEFINFYYQQLTTILARHDLDPDYILSKDQFLLSVKEQRLWGIISCVCLLPTVWLDEDVTTKILTDSEEFHQNINKDKSSFMKQLINENINGYKDIIMEVFEELVDKHILFVN